jgi:hypothetical protein
MIVDRTLVSHGADPGRAAHTWNPSIFGPTNCSQPVKAAGQKFVMDAENLCLSLLPVLALRAMKAALVAGALFAALCVLAAVVQHKSHKTELLQVCLH